MTRNPWQDFFDRCAPNYLTHSFTANTGAEVDFLVEELCLRAGQHVLDVGCGVGRHAIELARRGIGVTGIDLSNGMLEEARKAANSAGVAERINFIQADATRFSLDTKFDAAICLCEGAMTLMSGDEADPFAHDSAILRNVHHALKPGGRFVLTVLSALRPIRSATADDVLVGRFDPMTLIDRTQVESGDANVIAPQRHYVPSELRLLLTTCGFDVENIWGGTAGNWGRRSVDLDEIEIMAVARKPKRVL